YLAINRALIGTFGAYNDEVEWSNKDIAYSKRIEKIQEDIFNELVFSIDCKFDGDTIINKQNSKCSIADLRHLLNSYNYANGD
ncbi:MAG: hypothetical protein Q4B60_02145, partial [Erysipelotrichaceae bacterium]|nr:hypothetical protein [Erysipelotrichaceae bacterium]